MKKNFYLSYHNCFCLKNKSQKSTANDRTQFSAKWLFLFEIYFLVYTVRSEFFVLESSQHVHKFNYVINFWLVLNLGEKFI